MGILDKYNVTDKPPKLSKARRAADPMDKVNKKFLAGLERQLQQAKAWKPGAKDLRSWVTRDEENNRAWVTVKYGAWPVPLKGRTKTTIGPVKIDEVVGVFEDIRKAHAAGELEPGLKKVAFKAPRKKGANKAGKSS